MSRKFDYLGDVEVFTAVVEHGSFTAGAVALSTTPSVLSRAVTRTEARLGRQLLQRTTRRVGLTDAGRLYLEQVRTAFGLLDDAERDVLAQDGALAGRVRLSVPTTYGHYRLPPVLARFAQQYPQVQMELNITNRNVDLVAEGFDRPSAGPAAGQRAGGAKAGRCAFGAGGRAGVPAALRHAADAGRPAAAPVPAVRDAAHRPVGPVDLPRRRARRGLAAAFVH